MKQVVARATTYVGHYGDELSALVAREEYVQKVDERAGHTEVGGRRPTSRERVLLSEFALIQVAGGAGWEGFRDVFEVDGTPVRDRRDRLERLFIESPGTALQQARTIAEESARFNIGPIARNVNVPTAVLYFLHPSNVHRFRFERRNEEDISGRPAWVIGFQERTRPTIIRTPGHRDVPARGRMWIDPDTGRVLRTELDVSHFARQADESRARISVDFGPQPALAAWVPVEMREEYTAQVRHEGGVTVSTTTCVARYSNYRRFVTDARVVVPK